MEALPSLLSALKTLDPRSVRQEYAVSPPAPPAAPRPPNGQVSVQRAVQGLQRRERCTDRSSLPSEIERAGQEPGFHNAALNMQLWLSGQ